MNSTLQRYATPLITGLFVVSLVSGIALFFHFGSNWFREMHEWLSMVLILPFVLHLWKNWRAMTIYFTKPAFGITMAASLTAAALFAVQSGSGTGGPPQMALTRMILAKPVTAIAPLLDHTPDALVEHLRSAGFAVTGPDETLSDVAKGSGKSEFELSATLVQVVAQN